MVADNPGLWMLQCHNTYRQEAGMQTRRDYVFWAFEARKSSSSWFTVADCSICGQ